MNSETVSKDLTALCSEISRCLRLGDPLPLSRLLQSSPEIFSANFIAEILKDFRLRDEERSPGIYSEAAQFYKYNDCILASIEDAEAHGARIDIIEEKFKAIFSYMLIAPNLDNVKFDDEYYVDISDTVTCKKTF